MAAATLRHRIARREDIAALTVLVNAAILELQKPVLDAAQIESSRTIMGLDTQLIDDGTYFIVDQDGGFCRKFRYGRRTCGSRLLSYAMRIANCSAIDGLGL
jgi:hypothetical protein